MHRNKKSYSNITDLAQRAKLNTLIRKVTEDTFKLVIYNLIYSFVSSALKIQETFHLTGTPIK